MTKENLTCQKHSDSDIRSKVYNALAKISQELNVSEEEMNQAIEWFQTHFYEAD